MKYLSPNLVAVKRGENVKLSKNFWSDEFASPTSEWTLIDLRLVEKIQAMRDALCVPITITNGFRSQADQQRLKQQGYETAEGISTHEVGTAADLYAGGISGVELEKIAREAGFKAVGVGKTFVHVDLRSDKQHRRWTYSS